MRKSERVWGAWLLATVGSFAAIELPALKNEAAAVPDEDKLEPLTVVTRRLLGINPRRRYSRITAGTILGLFTWAVLHILDGIVVEK